MTLSMRDKLRAAVLIAALGAIYFFGAVRNQPNGDREPNVESVREFDSPKIHDSSEDLTARTPVTIVEPRAQPRIDNVARPILVRVMDQRGLPVAGATVCARVLGVDLELASTDPAGRVWVASPSATACSLNVRHDGYASEVVMLRAPYPEATDVLLLPGQTLSGRVVHEDGRSVGKDFCVVAWLSADRFPDTQLCVRAVNGDPNLLTARTDEMGAFRISGLRPEQPYSVSAGAPGFVVADPHMRVQAGGEPITLVVSRLFGLIVCLTDVATNGPIRIATSYLPPPDQGLLLKDPEADMLRGGLFTGVLGGLAPEQLLLPPSCQLYLFTSDEYAERVGPLEFRAASAGYERCTVTTWATPIERGPHVETIALEPTIECRGTLRLHSVGATPTRGQSGYAIPYAQVQLIPESGDHLTVLVNEISSDPLNIENVPCGTYRVVMSASPCGFHSPGELANPLIVEIRAPLVEAQLEVDGAGTIELDVRYDSGSPYHGPLSLVLLRGAAQPGKEEGFEGPGGQVFFGSRPYVVPFLDPDEYTVWMLDSGIVAQDGKTLTVAYARPNQRTVVPFTVQTRK